MTISAMKKITFYIILLCLVINLPDSLCQDGIEVEQANNVGLRIGTVGNDGIAIGLASDDGIEIFSAGDDGVFIFNAAGNGIFVETAAQNGMRIEDALHGIRIDEATLNALLVNLASTGLQVDSATLYGVDVVAAGKDGLRINRSAEQGLRIGITGDDGIRVSDAGDDGIDIHNAGGDGVSILSTGRHGVYIKDADTDALHVEMAQDDGVHIEDAADDGIFVEDATDYSMNIQGNKGDIGFGISSHIAQIYNRSPGPNGNVLALKTNSIYDVFQGSPRYISFFNSNDDRIGSIRPGENGNIMYFTGGSDFAEFLPSETTLEAGDIVGYQDGKILHNTSSVTQVMVVSDQAGFVGNYKSDTVQGEMVAFVGQVNIKVVGQVQQGDWIVPSGKHDGIGIAVSSEELTLDHRIVGRAWETNLDPQLKKVNCAVGLDQSQAKDEILKNQDERITRLEQTLAALLQEKNE